MRKIIVLPILLLVSALQAMEQPLVLGDGSVLWFPAKRTSQPNRRAFQIALLKIASHYYKPPRMRRMHNGIFVRLNPNRPSDETLANYIPPSPVWFWDSKTNCFETPE